MDGMRRIEDKERFGDGCAEIYFFDDQGNVVTEEKATRTVIMELDGNGELIQETFGFIGKHS